MGFCSTFAEFLFCESDCNLNCVCDIGVGCVIVPVSSPSSLFFVLLLQCLFCACLKAFL